MANELSNGSVRLRALEPADVDVLYQLENDSDVWRVSSTLAPFSRFQLEQYVLGTQNDIFANRQLRLMIEQANPENNYACAGAADIFDFEPIHRRAGVGILIKSEYREQGIATRSLEILIRYAFGTLQLHQLFCHISSDNAGSIRLFEKLGFTLCGIKKEWQRNGNAWLDERMYQLLNHDF